jgi:hypothetical protein
MTGKETIHRNVKIHIFARPMLPLFALTLQNYEEFSVIVAFYAEKASKQG